MDWIKRFILFHSRRNLFPEWIAYKYLMRLGIGNELKRVALNPEFPYKLAPVEEVLELHPELRLPS